MSDTSDRTGMRQVFMGLVVTAMGAAIMEHTKWAGFVQILMGAALTCLGIWKITRKSRVAREDAGRE